MAVRGWHGSISSVRGAADRRDAPGDGSITFLFVTPPEFGPRASGIHLLGDLNVNLVLRIDRGTFFRYSSNLPSPSTNNKVVRGELRYTNPTSFTTDLGVQKGFRVGKFRPEVFLEATNLFNKKNPKAIPRWNFFHDMPKYGLLQSQPTPVVQRQGGAIWDPYSSYQNRTRELYFGVRMGM